MSGSVVRSQFATEFDLFHTVCSGSCRMTESSNKYLFKGNYNTTF